VASAQAAAAHADPSGSGTAAPLTVTVHRDRPAVHEGDRVGYRIDVINRTTTDYPAASIIQLMPGGMRVVAVDGGGIAHDGETDWTLHLAPTAELHLAVTAVLGSRDQIDRGQFIHVAQPNHTDPASDGSEFSTTVCVRPSSEAHPLACSSDFAIFQDPDHGTGTLWLSAATAALTIGAGIAGYRIRRARAARARGNRG